MVHDPVGEEIDRELGMASRARRDGKPGLSRVCARRAAGAALREFLQRSPHPHWGTDVVSRLVSVSDDPAFDVRTRDAARRLSRRVSADFSYDPSGDPIEDARRIVSALRAGR